MPDLTQNNSTVATFDADEVRDLLLNAAEAAGASIPDMGEVEDMISATFQTTNVGNPINIDLANNTKIVLTLKDVEGEGSTPV